MRLQLKWTLALFFIVLQFSFAQEKSVSGTVKDESGIPLPGVAVLVKGTSQGTQTDFDGKYSISVKGDSVLIFSYVGMKSEERKVGNNSTINVTLKVDSQELDEVVVIGYGSGKQIGSVVGSVVKVSSTDIENRPSANVVDAIQGKVPGVQIFTSSGEPSALSSIRLHGVGSLGAGSTPLFVVDGIPVSSDAVRSLNQNDFENISILKDASATSIYGSRASNGVVYITTKKGKLNKSGEVYLKTQYGFSNLANRSTFENMMNASELADFLVETGSKTQAEMQAILDKNPHDTRWDKVYFREDIPSLQIDLSVSGGNEKTRYYVSAGYFNQEGLMYRSGFERYTFRSNIDTHVNNWLKMGVNASGAYYDIKTNPFTRNDTNGGLSLLAQPFYSPVDENGKEYDFIPGWGRFHPNYLATKRLSSSNGIEIIPTGYIEINPIESLTYKIQGGIQFDNGLSSSNRLPSYKGNLLNGTAGRTYSKHIQKTLTQTLEYRLDILKNKFTFLLGQEYLSDTYHSFWGQGEGLTNDNLLLLGHATKQKDVGESRSASNMRSLFGRIGYNYDQKYFVDISLRRDGSSKFGPKNRYANFWATGFMWKVKKESFLQNVDWLNDLSLKFSVGTSGNSDIGFYRHQALVGANGQYAGNSVFYISTPGNENLAWEKQTKYTLAINSDLFNRVSLGLEFYRRITSDMLMDVPVPYTTGFDEIKKNVGKLQNQGVDVSLSASVFESKDRKSYIKPYVSFNYNQERVLELFQGRKNWIIPNTGVGYAVGKPVTFFYPIFKRVNPENGLPEWYQPGDDLMQTTKDDSKVTSAFSAENLQQSTGILRYPPLNGGFGLSAGHKTISLQADFSFSYGKYLINNDRFFTENPFVFAGFNQSKNVRDYWKKPGDESRLPKKGVRSTEFDTRLLEDASFIRLKNLTVSYNVSKENIEQVGFFKSIRFYTTGRNLLTFTRYSGPDPEIDSNVTVGANPNTKEIVLGVEVKF